MAYQLEDQKRNWYVLHTYASQEEKAAQNLRRRISNLDMENKVFNILVPREKRIKLKHGERKEVEERIYRGYIFVEMIVDDDSWFVVRNTPGITGFLGSGTTPSPVSEEEMESIQKRIEKEEPEYSIDFEKGALVKIKDGAFKGFTGKVAEVDPEKEKIKVTVDVFGRETPVILDPFQVEKV